MPHHTSVTLSTVHKDGESVGQTEPAGGWASGGGTHDAVRQCSRSAALSLGTSTSGAWSRRDACSDFRWSMSQMRGRFRVRAESPSPRAVCSKSQLSAAVWPSMGSCWVIRDGLTAEAAGGCAPGLCTTWIGRGPVTRTAPITLSRPSSTLWRCCREIDRCVPAVPAPNRPLSPHL